MALQTSLPGLVCLAAQLAQWSHQHIHLPTQSFTHCPLDVRPSYAWSLVLTPSKTVDQTLPPWSDGEGRRLYNVSWTCLFAPVKLAEWINLKDFFKDFAIQNLFWPVWRFKTINRFFLFLLKYKGLQLGPWLSQSLLDPEQLAMTKNFENGRIGEKYSFYGQHLSNPFIPGAICWIWILAHSITRVNAKFSC